MNTTVLPTTLAQAGLKKYFFSSIGASAQAGETENLFMYIMWVNLLSFILLMFLLVYFGVKFHRSRQKANYQVSAAHHTPLELTWSIIPLLVMIPIFYWGFTGYADKVAAPADSEEISIYGKQWNWEIVYRNGATPQGESVFLTHTGHPVPEFVVPLGRPVKFIMVSRDVIHAFYIPDFRTKMDVIPNRYTSMWFLPEKLTNERDKKTGKLTYPDQPENPPHKVFCAEYCGQDHSEMAAQLRVLEPKDYEATIRLWTDYNKKSTLLDVGKLVWEKKGCASCHTLDGTKSTGPSWKNWFGDTHKYSDGSSHLSDENWLRDNILYSQKHIVEGYPTSMPIFAGQLNNLEVDAVILFIKSLSDTAKPQAAQQGARTVEQYREAEKAPKGGATPAPASPPPAQQ